MSSSIRVFRCAVLSVCVVWALCWSGAQVSAQTISPSVPVDFEVPIYVNGGAYQYAQPVTTIPQSQPFSWLPLGEDGIPSSAGGGVARWTSPFDVDSPSQPPSGTQYAFIQTSGDLQNATMFAPYSGLTVGTSYAVIFYVGTRGQTQTDSGGDPYPDDTTHSGGATLSTLFVSLDSTLIYQSPPNITDLSGWNYTVSSSFVATATSGTLSFFIITNYTDDHCILFDAITIVPASSLLGGSLVPTPGAALVPFQVSTFEFPVANTAVINGQTYQYTVGVSALQPWTWSLGGLAVQGSPFDPPAPTTPPSGSQYAIMQTSPNGNLGNRQANMSATIVGLSTSTTYVISLYYGVRRGNDAADTLGGGAGNFTETRLYILVDGVAYYVSPQNLTDLGGFTNVVSMAFTPRAALSGQAQLVILINSTTDEDHTILFDNVAVYPANQLPVYVSSSSARPAIGASSSAAPPVAALSPGSITDFEVAILNNGQYNYFQPVTVGQPFVFTGNPGGGLARWNSPFDAASPSQPPSGMNFAFLQNSGGTGSSMTASYVNLTVGQSYVMVFYIATRAQTQSQGNVDTTPGYASLSQIFLNIDGRLIYQSQANVSESTGWNYTVTSPFTALNTAGYVQFIVNTSFTDDHCILFDAITILPTSALVTGSLIPIAGAALMPNQLATFEFPIANTQTVNSQTYQYNVRLSALQPWTWSLGGVAQRGSPFDPPLPNTPPSGQQYAILQTSPNGLTGTRQANMSTTIAGLSTSTSYVVTFYWGVRKGNDAADVSGGGLGNYTETILSVLVDGVSYYTTFNFASDSAGFRYAISQPFTPLAANGGQAKLTIFINSTTDEDHTLLFDSVLILPAASTLSTAYLCYSTYSLPGPQDFPWSLATSLQFTYGTNPINTPVGLAYYVLSGTGSRTFTSKVGTTSTTAVTAVLAGTSNLLYVSTAITSAVDTSGLSLRLASPVQLPGAGPNLMTTAVTLVGAAKSISEYGAFRVDGLGQVVASTLPGFANISIGAANVNSLAPIAGVCAAPISFTNGQRVPAQPSNFNGGVHVTYGYFISDGLTYSVNTTLQLTMSSAFGTPQDQLGNNYQTAIAASGTRVYTYLPTGAVLASTITGLATVNATGASQRFYPYSLLTASPGVYSTNSAPFIDANGIQFTVSPSVPLDGAPANSTSSLSSSIRVSTFNSATTVTIVAETNYVTLPVITLQQQTYSFV